MASIVAFGTERGLSRSSGCLDALRSLTERTALAAVDLPAADLADVVCLLVAEEMGADRCEFAETLEHAEDADATVPLVAGGRAMGVLALWWPSGARVPVERLAELHGVAAVLALALGTVAAIDAERERIGHDLHDSVAQVLTGIGLSLADELADVADDAMRARLRGVVQLAERANNEVRAAIDGLVFGDPVDDLGAALAGLCRRAQDVSGAHVAFAVRGTPHPLSYTAKNALYRVAHEALTNVQRHAHASTVSVELSYRAHDVALAVRDDGIGFGRVPAADGLRHFGISSMRRRIEEAGGCLFIGTAAPHGVAVEAVIPGRKVAAHAPYSGGHRR